MSGSAIEIAQRMNELSRMEDVPEEVKQDTLDSMKATIEQKLDGLRLHMIDVQKDLATLSVDLDRMKAIRQTIKRLEKDLEWCNEYETAVIQATGKDKIRTDKHIYAVKHRSYSVNVLDESKIPEEFKQARTTYHIDKKAIKDAINGGQPVPGAELKHNLKTVID